MEKTQATATGSSASSLMIKAVVNKAACCKYGKTPKPMQESATKILAGLEVNLMLGDKPASGTFTLHGFKERGKVQEFRMHSFFDGRGFINYCTSPVVAYGAVVQVVVKREFYPNPAKVKHTSWQDRERYE